MNLALDLARRRLGNDPAFDRLGLDLEKLNDMIGKLLTVAKLESGAVPIARESVDLSRLAAEVVTDAEIEARERGCSLVYEDGGKCQVKGDESLLRSAIENVIRNAVYYTHRDTEIRVALSSLAEAGNCFIALAVSDRGPGVPEKDRENIFKPFYRVAEARDRQSGGAGLGLAIASRVVKLHRGRIRATNRPGGGLEIHIELPAVPG
jgi:two-component system sensor histidine kinase CpxA